VEQQELNSIEGRVLENIWSCPENHEKQGRRLRRKGTSRMWYDGCQEYRKVSFCTQPSSLRAKVSFFLLNDSFTSGLAQYISNCRE